MHFICEATTSTFFFVVTKTSLHYKMHGMYSIYSIIGIACRSIKQITIPSYLFLLQNKVNWTHPGARVKLGTLHVTNLLFISGCLLLRWNITEALLFYSDFRSDIIMKASSALIRREKRSRQEITFKGSDHRWEENTRNDVVIFFNTFADFVQSFSVCWSSQYNFV